MTWSWGDLIWAGYAAVLLAVQSRAARRGACQLGEALQRAVGVVPGGRWWVLLGWLWVGWHLLARDSAGR